MQCINLFAQSCSFWSWLSNWQTLVAGLLALLAGVGSIIMINRQIRLQKEIHDAARISRHMVAKAKIPLAAAEAADHAETYLKKVEELAERIIDRDHQPFGYIGPKFPEEAAAILDCLVENAIEPIAAELVSALYAEQQVMSSRMSNVADPSSHSLCVEDYLLQPVMIDAIAIKFLAYARDGAELTPLTWEEIETGVRRLIKNRALNERIMKYISGKMERGTAVPLALRRHNA